MKPGGGVICPCLPGLLAITCYLNFANIGLISANRQAAMFFTFVSTKNTNNGEQKQDCPCNRW